MKKYFIASLCKNGILGGGITVDLEAVTYHTGKVTVPQKYRKLQMKYTDILEVSSGWLFILPGVTVTMRDGEVYKFVIFGRTRFVKCLKEMGGLSLEVK